MGLLLVDFSGPTIEGDLAAALLDEFEYSATLSSDFSAEKPESPNFRFRDSTGQEQELHPGVTGSSVTAAGQDHDVDISTGDLRALLTSLERVYLRPQPMLEKERILDGWLAGWETELDKIPGKFRVVIFPRLPHFHWDMALSLVLQRRGVSVYALSDSAVNGFLLLAQLKGTQVDRFVQTRKPATLSDLFAVADETSVALLEVSKNRNRDLIDYHLLATQERNVAKRLVRALRTLRETLNGATTPVPYWSLSTFERVVLSREWFHSKAKILAYLDKVGLRNLPTQKYAYFALHFQPEMSSTPAAGDYWFQLNAIRRLRAHLPSEYTIIVGEHPSQIFRSVPDLRQTLFRSEDFYREMLAMGGVRLAHWSLTGANLIEKASLVATLTGSSAWEAMKSGIPAVVFGQTWYSHCQGCVLVKDSSTLTREITRVLDMSPDDISADTQAARQFAIRNGVPGYNYLTTPPALSEKDRELLARQFAKRIASLVAGKR